MKKTISFLLTLALVIHFIPLLGVFALESEATDVYVSAEGTGEGLSSEAPLGSVTAAIEKAADLAADGEEVTIHVSGTAAFDFAEAGTLSYNVPVHSGTVTITGDGTGILTFSSSGQAQIVFGGSTVFENITLSTSNNIVFITDANDFEIGVGVSTSGSFYICASGSINSLVSSYVSNRFDGSKFEGDARITVLSGKFAEVQIFRGNGLGPIDGNAYIKIGGTAEIGRLNIWRSSKVNCTVNDATIVLDGGVVSVFAANHDGKPANNSYGASHSFHVVLTDNFDISGSFTAGGTGLSGICAGTYSDSSYITTLKSMTNYVLHVQDKGLYDNIISGSLSSKVRSDYFSRIEHIGSNVSISYVNEISGDGTVDDLAILSATDMPEDVEVGLMFAEETYATDGGLKLLQDGGSPLFTKIPARYTSLLISRVIKDTDGTAAVISADKLDNTMDTDYASVIAVYWQNLPVYQAFAARLYLRFQDGTTLYGPVVAVSLSDTDSYPGV
ncbi:MAG: hypothetical protein IJU75_06220 [Clostridia bacterium]|nr:hypothetical protein [Clostridia bacterium]